MSSGSGFRAPANGQSIPKIPVPTERTDEKRRTENEGQEIARGGAAGGDPSVGRFDVCVQRGKETGRGSGKRSARRRGESGPPESDEHSGNCLGAAAGPGGWGVSP